LFFAKIHRFLLFFSEEGSSTLDKPIDFHSSKSHAAHGKAGTIRARASFLPRNAVLSGEGRPSGTRSIQAVDAASEKQPAG
jgi:hypothetical protein